MARSVRSAKTALPRISNVHPRARLFRELDAATRQRIVWIQAPAGAGKTVLVASWLAARRLSAIWLEIEKGDDPGRVFGHLRAAAQELAGRGVELPALRPEHLAAPGAYARRFFEALAEQRRRPAVIVLDDYDALEPGSLVHEMLRDGVAGMDGLTLVVACRDEPPREWARLRAAGAIAVLGARSLSLTRSEARAVASLRSGRRALPDAALALAKGWAAGVVLLSMTAGDPDPERSGRRGVRDFLAVEVFERLDPRVRKVLLRTCLLPSVDAATAAALGGDREAGAYLSDLARLGSFTDRLEGATPVYRYHELFRELLQARARAELGPEGFADVARRSAAALTGCGDVHAALELLASVEEWEELASVLLRHGPVLVGAGRAEALRRWIDQIPGPVAEREPWLRYWGAVALFRRVPAGAVLEMAQTYAEFVARRDAAGAYMSWAAVADMTVFCLDDLKPLGEMIDALADLRERFPRFPGSEVAAAVAASALGAYANARPADPALAAWEERAVEIALGAGEPRVRLNAGRQALFRRAYWGGDVVGSRPLIDAISVLASAEDASLTDALVWHVLEASWHCHAGDGITARAVARKGLELAARSGVDTFDVLLQAEVAFGSLAEEDFGAAEEALGAMAPGTGPRGRLALAAWHHVAAVVAIRRGRMREAVQRARAALQVSEEAGHPPIAAAAAVSWAVAAAHGGGPGPGLAEAAARASGAGFQYGSMGARLASASFTLARGDEEEACLRLAEVLPELRRTGCLNAVWLSRGELAELCAFAIERGIEAEFAARFAAARRLEGCARARLLERWPWRVRVRALGGLGVVGGEPVPSARRGARPVPLQLLKLLVAHGEQGARAEVLSDALWPHADGDDARHALETALYRLRRVLGDQDAVTRRGERIALDARCVFVDAWALEAIAARVRQLGGPGSERLVEAAAALGGGELFGDDDDPRIAFARERVSRAAVAIGLGRATSAARP
jgi:ATP/maltotriose-dependent transcriptional regulator MalT